MNNIVYIKCSNPLEVVLKLEVYGSMNSQNRLKTKSNILNLKTLKFTNTRSTDLRFM